ncbi:MAG TPA: dephospho-CoA kinase [Euzebyales bacterium]|nr:dephospho-CoA kinase [Euzebyales bacterium]
MFLIGLTGGIASGKSTVAERFVRHGAELIDADAVAREVTQPGTEAYHDIVEHFGREVLDEDGFIDRPALGAIVFSDPSQRAVLNEITHPPILAAIADQLELLVAFDGCVVLDVPLLVETEVDRRYDAVVVVATSEQTQIQRLMRHRGLGELQAKQRVASQAPLEAKLARATHVIWNDDGLAQLRERADEIAERLCAAARQKAADDLAGRND